MDIVSRGTSARVCSASADERIKYLNRTGTSVKDSAKLASSDTHTDSDKGEKRYFAVPCNRKIGTKTMQMQRVDNIVGTPTSPAPPTIATSKASPSRNRRSMFSMTTVPLSTRM